MISITIYIYIYTHTCLCSVPGVHDRAAVLQLELRGLRANGLDLRPNGLLSLDRSKVSLVFLQSAFSVRGMSNPRDWSSRLQGFDDRGPARGEQLGEALGLALQLADGLTQGLALRLKERWRRRRRWRWGWGRIRIEPR